MPDRQDERPFIDAPLKQSLEELWQGQVCIVGVGNRQRGDDGAGPRVIAERDPGAPGFWLDAGVAPENYLERIAGTNPDVVLIVDAVSFGGFPGECRLLPTEAIDLPSLSTHTGSLHLVSRYLKARIGARIELLAIQPQSLGGQRTLSRPVERSVATLASLLSSFPSNPA